MRSDRALGGNQKKTRSIVRIVLREKLAQDHRGRLPFPARRRQKRRIERLGRLGRAHVRSHSRKVRFGPVELPSLEIHATECSAQLCARRLRLIPCDERLEQRRGRCKVLFSPYEPGRRGGEEGGP